MGAKSWVDFGKLGGLGLVEGSGDHARRVEKKLGPCDSFYQPGTRSAGILVDFVVK